MKVVILCGGRGIRLDGESSYIPKAMVRLGHRPIVWHVMKRYSLYGYNDFILALGYKGEIIRNYFANYQLYANDIALALSKPENFANLTTNQEADWKITMVDTGELAMTGARIARLKKYLQDENQFMITYADCLSTIDINKLLKHHQKIKKIATITGVIPPYREGEFLVKNNLAVSLYNNAKNKSTSEGRYINAGYMVFEKEIFNYLSAFNECKLETEVFERLMKDHQLAIFVHHGFWRWIDTDGDYLELKDLIDKNQMRWLTD